MSDRVFFISFAVSMAFHLLLLVGQLLRLNWFTLPNRSALKVVYETAVAEHELQALQEQLSRAQRDMAASPAPNALGERPQIRIPDRPLLTGGRELSEIMPDRSSVVDLTNLVDASRGDPVLLSYFSAIREQIQLTANKQAWLAGESGQGLVYVSFVLSASGAAQGVTIVTERSVDRQPLWDAALHIVKTASPFPPFPPSMTEPSKTIVVPLEFLMGSS